MPTATSILQHLPATILSLELLLGGQLRVTSLLTPALHERVMRTKSVGTAKFLYPIVPIRDPKLNTQFIGVLMCLAGGLVAWPETHDDSALRIGKDEVLAADRQHHFGHRGVLD